MIWNYQVEEPVLRKEEGEGFPICFHLIFGKDRRQKTFNELRERKLYKQPFFMILIDGTILANYSGLTKISADYFSRESFSRI